MTTSFYILSLLYIAALAAVVLLELKRSGRLSADPIGVFVVLTSLQCIVPAIAIFALLPNTRRGYATGVEVFDRIYAAVDVSSGYMVFGLTLWFLVFFYASAVWCESALSARFDEGRPRIRYRVDVAIGRLVALLGVGLAVSALVFQAMGDTTIERYANLILLRSEDVSSNRTSFAVDVLSFMQAWSWLTVIALFSISEKRGRRILWCICLAMLVVFSMLGVSRRAIFLPPVFAYFIFVMNDGHWRVGKLAVMAAIVLPFVAFGEEIFGAVGYGGSVDSVEHTYGSITTGALRTTSEIGITVTESLGTLSLIDLPPRYGIDHLLSMARRFPEGLLGLDIEFPDRIVRTSTVAFSDSWQLDIPPGLLGQMWLDLRVLGPALWGLALGIQIGALQFAFRRTQRSLQAAATYFVLAFVVALPINSGSFDFTFSIDIILLIFVLAICVRIRRVPANVGSSSATMGFQTS